MRGVTLAHGATQTSISTVCQLIQTLERGKFDAFFMADHLTLLNMPLEALKRSHTSHIGLVATASTTYDKPFHIARRLASLDHLSGGRADWNIVTTSNPGAARNFGHSDEMEHGERYTRAREFYDVITGLWDSWADDAFVRDAESGHFFDPERLHVLNHHGKYLTVRGPLHIARPVQGWLVIVQAGASEAGRQLAAETAEVVFSSPGTLDNTQTFLCRRQGTHAYPGPQPRPLKDP